MQKPINEKREQLKALSQQVAELVEAGEYLTINEAIMTEFYKKNGNTEFNTYKQWKEKGFQVRKGEKAYTLWAKPLSAQKTKEEATPEEQESKSNYFPICHLFSNLQVEKMAA